MNLIFLRMLCNISVFLLICLCSNSEKTFLKTLVDIHLNQPWYNIVDNDVIVIVVICTKKAYLLQ